MNPFRRSKDRLVSVQRPVSDGPTRVQPPLALPIPGESRTCGGSEFLRIGEAAHGRWAVRLRSFAVDLDHLARLGNGSIQRPILVSD
jgi:hypothetical protein